MIAFNQEQAVSKCILNDLMKKSYHVNNTPFYFTYRNHVTFVMVKLPNEFGGVAPIKCKF